MSVRHILDRAKEDLSVATDRELALKIGANPTTLEKWVQRDKLPDKWVMIIRQKSEENKQLKDNNLTTYEIPEISLSASAGDGTDLEGIEVFQTGKIIHIDKALFKTKPKNKLGIIQVDGYSMIPMLLPDSWVIYETANSFSTDGLYILNYQNNLMVKLLQLNMGNDSLDIISINKEYQSYTITKDNQSAFHIIGKVIKTII